jgi:hypothetical protein
MILIEIIEDNNARQDYKHATEYIGQPKYSIAGFTPPSVSFRNRHVGDPATEYV